MRKDVFGFNNSPEVQNSMKIWAQQFEDYDADGIDFVELNFNPRIPGGRVLRSFTKEQFLSGVSYPRSNYFFWKRINGKKVYIIEKTIPANHTTVTVVEAKPEHNGDMPDAPHNETIRAKLTRLGADGIDFVSFGFRPEDPTRGRIFASYTKDEFMNVVGYPKSPYHFWKIIDGKKTYLDHETGKPVVCDNANAHVNVVGNHDVINISQQCVDQASTVNGQNHVDGLSAQDLRMASYIYNRYQKEFGKCIPEMGLHKLAYFAQRESMVCLNKFMFGEIFQGWRLGPVIPELRTFYAEGAFDDSVSDKDIGEYLPVMDYVFKNYAIKSPESLSLLSRGELSWKNARVGIPQNASSNRPMANADIAIDAARIKHRREMLTMMGYIEEC